MIRIKTTFLIAFMLTFIIIFSNQAKAGPADTCNCDDISDCSAGFFCDITARVSGGCTPGVYNSLCVALRTQGRTCYPYDYPSIRGGFRIGLNCTSITGDEGRCCPNSQVWNSVLGQCAPPPTNPCAINGASLIGNNYCLSINPLKPNCCGTPGNGHCEACCVPEATYRHCSGFCKACNSTGAIGTWNCINQEYTDYKDECIGLQVCQAGSCVSLHSGDSCGITPTGSCPRCVEKDGVVTTLVFCTYGCPGNCDPRYYFCREILPGYELYVAGCCIGDAVPGCAEICVKQGAEGCNNYKNLLHPEGCCNNGIDICSNNHCCSVGSYWSTASNTCLSCEIGMIASSDSDCKACNTEWYLDTTYNRCCLKGMYWDSVRGECVARDPCYSAPGFTTSSSFCNFFAPNIGSYGTCSLSSWLSSSPLCVNYLANPAVACCFVNAGLYGYVLPGEQFYYWHERIPVVVY